MPCGTNRSQDTLSGKPRIKGHRIGVHRVAGWWKSGLSIEEVGQRLSALTPAEIHAALLRRGPDVKLWLINMARGTDQLERVRFDSLNPTFLLSVVKDPGTSK